jgi:hypothetical protein
MRSMNGNAYKLLGFAVWTGAKWYLRRRLPAPRKVVLSGLAVAGALTVASALVRRSTT